MFYWKLLFYAIVICTIFNGISAFGYFLNCISGEVIFYGIAHAVLFVTGVYILIAPAFMKD